MNTPIEAIQNALTFLSLQWSIGEIHRVLTRPK